LIDKLTEAGAQEKPVFILLPANGQRMEKPRKRVGGQIVWDMFQRSLTG
jgi:hypothetical protein